MKSYTWDCKYQRLLLFHQKNTSEQHRFFVYRIRSRKKINKKQKTWKWRRFFSHRNFVKKVRRRSKIVDFSAMKITSKKVRQNDINFSPIKIISKRYVEMTWKFGNIYFSIYRCISIDIDICLLDGLSHTFWTSKTIIYLNMILFLKWQQL